MSINLHMRLEKIFLLFFRYFSLIWIPIHEKNDFVEVSKNLAVIDIWKNKKQFE